MSSKMKENVFVYGWTLAIGVVLFGVPIFVSWACGKEMGLF